MRTERPQTEELQTLVEEFRSRVPADHRDTILTMPTEARHPLAEARKPGCVLLPFPHTFRKTRVHINGLQELCDPVPCLNSLRVRTMFRAVSEPAALSARERVRHASKV